MKERSQEMMAFLIGAVAGGAAALLLAPTSGAELRQRIGEEADKTRDLAQQRVRAAGDRVSERYTEASDSAHRLVADAKHSAEHYRDAVGAAVREGVKAYERELGKAS